MREGETLFDLLTQLGACQAIRSAYYEFRGATRATYDKAPPQHITWLVGALGTKSERAWVRRYWSRHALQPGGSDWWQGKREDKLAAYYLAGVDYEYPENANVSSAIRERFPYERVLEMIQNA